MRTVIARQTMHLRWQSPNASILRTACRSKRTRSGTIRPTITTTAVTKRRAQTVTANTYSSRITRRNPVSTVRSDSTARRGTATVGKIRTMWIRAITWRQRRTSGQARLRWASIRLRAIMRRNSSITTILTDLRFQSGSILSRSSGSPISTCSTPRR